MLTSMHISVAGLCIALTAALSSHAGATTLIRAGHVILPDQNRMLEHQAILIDSGRIAAIGNDDGTLKGDTTVDLSAMTVLPGLLDMHTHLTIDPSMKDPVDEMRRDPAQAALASVKNVRTKLLSGFTTVREAGSYWAFVDVAVRDAINRGEIAGPTMYVPGAMITMTGGGGAVAGLATPIILPRELRFGEANGPIEIRARIRDVVNRGADVIKTFATGAVLAHGSEVSATEFTLEELEAAVSEATHLGRRVMVHAHAAAGIKNAIKAGAASIEHGTMLDDEAISMMVKRGTYLVPTLAVSECIGADSGRPEEFLRKARDIMQQHTEGFRRAVRAGVKIALGSDSVVCPHDRGARELHYMVQGGMTPMRAIRAATVDAADLLGVQDVGAIAPGKRADIIAVAGNPLLHVEELEAVKFVMKGGTVYLQQR